MAALPALSWIIQYLENHDIPYVVCGGLAAIAYGSTRSLNDIDVYIPDAFFDSVVEFGRPYITYGPTHHKGKLWDLTYVQFRFQGQAVEVGSDNDCKIYNAADKNWHSKIINFDQYEYRTLFGMTFKVMPVEDLIHYKAILNRPVDIEDIHQITQHRM